MTYVSNPVACPGTVAVVTDTSPHPSHTALPAYVVGPPIGPGVGAQSSGIGTVKCGLCNGAGWLPKGKCPDCLGLGRERVKAKPDGD